MNILVIDDYESYGESLVELLQALGHEAEYAPSYQDAEWLLELFEFEVALLDFDLPVLTGPKIAEELMLEGRDPNTPVAVVQAASTSGQLTIRGTLSDISGRAASSGIASPATVIIGEVAALYDELAWRPNECGPSPFPPGARVTIQPLESESTDEGTSSSHDLGNSY